MQIGRLIERGDLRASRFGRAWIVDRESLQRYAAARPGRGRPLSAAVAWRRLAIAKAASLEDVRQLANECRRRSVPVAVRILPGELDSALDDRRLVLGAADAAIARHAAVGQPRERVAYVRASDLDGFLDDHFAERRSEESNVLLRVVGDDVWPFGQERFVDPVVAAIDLIDIGDVRSAAEAIR